MIFTVSTILDGELIRDSISQIVPEGGVAAGDWAPILTLGTHARALYTDKNFNRGSPFWKLRRITFFIQNLQIVISG